VHTLLQDIRYAWRQLCHHPGFALTAILSLALGIGATVSVFSVIYGVLLHPFPYRDVDRLANLSIRDPRQGNLYDVSLSGEQLHELKKVHAFESLATWRSRFLVVTGGNIPENLNAFYGIGETFPSLGVSPLLGRNLGPSDSPEGQEPQPVVMLHYRFWQRHFNGDPAIIGKTLELNHKQYTIIGVTRPNFTWDWAADVYLPQTMKDGGGVVVKLRPGVSLSAADAEVQPLLDRFAKEHPLDFQPGSKVDIRSLTYETTQNMGSTLYLLFGAVAMLLAIGCSNVSILLLARGTARQHEFAVRSAVGAGGFRIVRQLLTESLLLAISGTALGILLASRLLSLIVAWLPEGMFPRDVAIHINLPVLLFSVALALLSTVFFGLVPALQMAKPEISHIMQSGTKRTAGSVRGKRLHGTLVAAQIALTLLLLTAAGAAIDSFIRVLRIPLGYDPHNVVAVGIPLHDNTYMNWQARVNYFEQLRASIAALPDVISASVATDGAPPNNGWEQRFDLLGKSSASPDAQYAKFNLIDQDYFHTLQTPLLEGRVWTSSEVAHGAQLAIVNETFARQYFPEGSILGHSIKPLDLRNDPGVLNAPAAGGWMQVIGVVADSINAGIDHPIRPAMFVPYSTELWMGTEFLVRTRVAPETIENAIRRQIDRINPDQQALGTIASLEKWIRDEPVWARGRLTSALFAGFSILALILSAVGLYSVVSYSVAQRTNEFGIRLALGAQKSDVAKIVLASAGLSVGLGVAAGLALSLSLNRVISSWVGNTANHPLIVLSVSFLLIVIAVVACLAPARRASSVDPMTALRCE
jgi:predicted permease